MIEIVFSDIVRSDLALRLNEWIDGVSNIVNVLGIVRPPTHLRDGSAAYECDGRRYETVPASARTFEKCRPVYEEWKGWQTPTRGVTRFDDLPQKAKDYVLRLCELTGVPLGILSVGPSRDSTLRIAL